MSTSGRSEASPVELQRVGGGPSRQRLSAAALVVIVLIGVAWIKPWESRPDPIAQVVPTRTPASSAVTSPTPRITQPPVVVAPTVRPTIDPDRALASRRLCQGQSKWGILTIGTSSQWLIRTMYSATPVEAAKYFSPRIEPRLLVADTMTGLGLCVPPTARAEPAEFLDRIRLWHEGSDFFGPVEDLQILDRELFDVGEAYFGPPRGQTWSAGTYFFEIRPASRGGQTRWLALNFEPTAEQQ